MDLAQIVAFAKSGTSFQQTVSQTEDVGSGADRVAFVLLGNLSTATYGPCVPDSVVVGGTDTLSNFTTVYNPYLLWAWRLFWGPLTVSGSQAFVGSFDISASESPHMIGVVYSGAAAAANIAFAQDLGGDTSWSRSVTSAADEVAVLMQRSSAAKYLATVTNGTAATGTGLTTSGTPTQYSLIARAGVGGSTALNGTWDSGAYTDADCIFSITAAAGGGGPTLQSRKLLLGVGA